MPKISNFSQPNLKAADLANSFNSLPDDFRPVPWLCYTGKCSETEVYRSIDEMYEQGIRSFFIFPIYGLEIEYLSEEWFDIVEKTLAYCKKKAMTAWIYDDYNWPNGSCAGKLLEAYPESAIHSAKINISLPVMPGEVAEIVSKGEFCKAYRIDSENNIFDVEVTIEHEKEAFRIKWKNNTNAESSFLILTTAYFSGMYVANKGSLWCKGHKEYGFTDLLRKDASKQFIKMTYEAYYERFKDYFGKVMPGFFNDESSVFGNHYNQELAYAFRKRNGKHLKDELIHLFVSNSPERFKIRYDYWSLVGEKLGAHLKRLNDWCTRHEINLTGHFLGEECPEQEISSQGDIWPVRKHMSIPGADLLKSQSNYKAVPAQEYYSVQKYHSPSGLILTIKVAAATARFNGAQRVMCEAFGAMPYNITPIDQVTHTHWLTALGINLINDNLLTLSFESFRKRAQGGKHFTMPWWKYYRDFAEFSGRCSMMSAVGRVPARIGLLYPALTAQVLKCDRKIKLGTNSADQKMLTQTNRLCQHTAEALIRGHWDWEVIFEEIWKDARLESGKAQIADLNLTTILIPAAHALSIEVFEKLEAFAGTGGKITFLGAIPTITIDEGFHVKNRVSLLLKMPNVSFITTDDDSWEFIFKSLTDNIIEPPAAHLTGIGIEEILIVRRCFENRDIFHISNMGNKQSEFYAEFDTDKPLTLWNPENGKIYSLKQKNSYHLCLLPGQGYFIVGSNDETAANDEYNHNFETDIASFHSPYTKPDKKFWKQRSLGLTEWYLVREKPNIARLSSMVKFDKKGKSEKERWHNGEPDNSWTKVEQGKLPSPLNPLESQFIWYKAAFKAEHIPADLAIVLDNMDFSEVFLNGEKLESPRSYTLWDYANIKFDIADKVKQGNNILAVKARVSDYYHPDICLNGIFASDCAEPIVLIGNFYHDTYQKDIACLRKSQTVITPGDWSAYGMKNYMGTLTYKRTIEFESQDKEVWLDLGNVYCVAELRINNKKVGRRCWAPYRFRIDKFLKKGNNLFEIEVTNTMANIIERSGWDCDNNVKEFEPKSGLYGPIRFYSR